MAAPRIPLPLRSFARLGADTRGSLAVLLIGLGLVAVVYQLLDASYNDRSRKDFETQAEAYGRMLQSEIEEYINVLQEIGLGLTTSSSPYLDDLAVAVAQHMEFYPLIEVGSVAWVPRLYASQRAWAESELRRRNPTSQGLLEIAPEGGFIAAAERALYFPVLLVEPPTRYDTVVGLDLASAPDSLQILTRARDTAIPSVSMRLVAVNPVSRDLQFLSVPVYSIMPTPETLEERRSSLQGYIVAITDIGRMTQTMTGFMDEFFGGVCFTLARSLPDNSEHEQFYENKCNSDIGPPPYETRTSIAFGDQEWILHSWPSEAFLTTHDFRNYNIFAVSGLSAFVIAVALFLGYRTRKEIRIKQTSRGLVSTNQVLSQNIEITEALLSIASLIAQPGDVRKQMREVLDVLILVSESYHATLGVWHQGKRLFLVSSGTDYRGEHPNGMRRRPGGIIDQVLRNRASVVVNDVAEFNPASKFVQQEGVKSVAAIPISLYQDSLEGVILIRSRQKGHFTPELINLIERMKEPLSSLIQNSRLRQELEQERAIVARKDDFISIASHELRTPLTSLVGFSALLLQNDVPTEMREPLSRIHRNALHLTRVINDVLDIAGINREPFVLEQVRVETEKFITELLYIFAGTDRTADVRLDLTHAPSHIYVEPNLLSRVLLNLLSNAFKYSTQGSLIELSVAAGPNRDEVVFCVADHGIGMKTDDIKRIFSPYYRSSDQRVRGTPGTGVGLYVVHEIVKEMGGLVTVSSILGSGSRFCVTLPSLSNGEAPLTP